MRSVNNKVRSVRGTADIEAGGAPPASAVCRVRGAVWVMLSGADPVAIQLSVLAQALRKEAPKLVEQKFLAPAVRALLDATETK